MSNRCYNITWNAEYLQISHGYFGLAIPALIFHVLFWIQVATHRSLRQMSMLWVYNYLFTDLLLLVQLLVEYSLRTTIPYCISRSTYRIFCSIEAYLSVCMTVLEAYVLVCLNITRYYLIVKNVDISARYPYILLLVNVLLYVFAIVIIVIQVELFQTVNLRLDRSSKNCHFQFGNLVSQLGNLTIVLLIPILLNCYLMTLTAIHVRRSQQTVQSQRSKHLQLLIQVFAVYIIWLLLWAPNVAISYFIWNEYRNAYTRFGSILNALCNPFIFMFIDRRFLRVWKKTFYGIIHYVRPSRQIQPTTIMNEIRGSTIAT